MTRALLLQLGDASTGLTDDERTGHPVPGLVDRLEVRIESPRAYPRQIERGRAVATEIADLTEHAREDACLLLAVVRNVREAGRDERAFEVGDRGRAESARRCSGARDPCAPATLGTEELVADRVVHDARERTVRVR